MITVEITTQMEIHDAFRYVTKQALETEVGKKHIEDAGAGMTNVYMDILGYDQAILQCYPHNEFNCVYILISKNAEEHSIEIDELPEFLQKEVFDAYCEHLQLKIN